MASFFRLNPALVPQLKADPRVKTTERVYAQAAMARAKSLAPRRSGTYASKFRVSGARLENTDAGALSIEFGTAHTPMYAPMRRAAETIGAVVVDGRSVAGD